MIDDEETVNSGGFWLPISDMARIKNVSRQAIDKRLRRLEAAGNQLTRIRDGRREIDVAAYDHAVGEVGDAFREQAASTRKELDNTAAGDTLRGAQANKMSYEARLRALDLAERTRNLIPVQGEHGLENALVKVSETIIRELGSPLNWTTELIAAAGEGEAALRRLLKKKIREQRLAIATRLLEVAAVGCEAQKAGIEIEIQFDD